MDKLGYSICLYCSAEYSYFCGCHHGVEEAKKYAEELKNRPAAIDTSVDLNSLFRAAYEGAITKLIPKKLRLTNIKKGK